MLSINASATITLPLAITPAQEQRSPITESLNATEHSLSADEQHISAIINLLAPQQSITALSVWDIEDNRSVYQHNDQMLMNPASIQKLLTALVSAKQLGADFRYQTQLLTSAPAINNAQILDADVYLKFSGDPKLSHSELTNLVSSLKAKGIKHISGNVYLIGHNNKYLQAPGWVWDDLGICYAAPLSSFIIDKNCVYARLSANGYNQKATLKVMGNKPIFVENNAFFVNPSSKDNNCHLQLIRHDNNQFTLTGCHIGAKSLPLAIAISNPESYAVNVVKNIFEQQQLTIAGSFTITEDQLIDRKITLVAEHLSEPVAQLIDEMLLDSDNLIAEALLRTSAEHYFSHSVNFSQTTQAMVDILTDLGIDLTNANIADGSGLSRYNLLSAQQVLAVLKLMANTKQYQYLLSSLPIAGKSGTLKYKRYYNKAPLKNKVQAKTGSMLGVANLAGEFTASNGKRYLFVLIENGLSPTIKKHQKAPFSAIVLQNLMDIPLVTQPEAQQTNIQ
ncbi:D-alanyl-D-alanine carboxypeptidase/D-alanyl-D-alanine endopeptidase [Shewanella aestuarii]|uniref:D-alanyl-D-alanine carboxypeptidase/D-alanyl-D-alanine-endopeptidase n=1 Tax=Shewanella aestuarii TaxID=1028752 RepID=A0A6G9QJ94_9GAMM|nr:D-alanyl-D-alanine carboxypeptidase/D-alanyl-D-alanine-endopeptidase [Shewanella aestuarii]QIR14620.1 D-alanyl-D-alanine carboxypeptidase/D-alanyl-D-alanine-endopeptidase [Shewanella aestuarii]